MGIIDKITGRAKQAAGDLAGDQSLKREGAQEERKGEAKEELTREEARAEAAEARADVKAAEVEELEERTDPGQLAGERSQEELYEDARDLGVEGRSEMTKDELADEVRRRT